MTRRSINLIQFWLKVGLFSVPALAFALAGYIRFYSGHFAQADPDLRSYEDLTIFVTLLWALVVEHLRLNRIETLLTLQTGVITATKATIYCVLFAMSGLFFYRGTSFARLFMVLGCIFIFFLTLGMIHLFRGVAYVLRGSLNGRFRVAVLGTDELAVGAARHLSQNPLTPCNVACFVALPSQASAGLDAPVLTWDRLDDVVEVFHCKEIMVALPLDRLGEIHKLLESVQRLCIPARVVLDLGQGVFAPDRIFDFCGLSLLDVRPYAIDTVGYAVGKRIFDIIFSVLALLLAAPFMLLIATIIKLTSPGPIFFVQDRVGLNGEIFPMYKFRTMQVSSNKESDTVWTTSSDPRRTRLGAFLRKTSLDELPQFFNVLRGNMSVVGPRPERPCFVQQFQRDFDRYSARHGLKVGITGWAQVNGLRGDTSIEKRMEYDLHYLRHWNLVFDLKILAMTVYAVLASRNAY
ncbi:MAG: sugar transferase [Terriglobales bacterium]